MRSYYPLFPPALGSFLDTSLGAALTLPVTPDVLLLPSNLAPFAKVAPVGAGDDGPKVSTNEANASALYALVAGTAWLWTRRPVLEDHASDVHMPWGHMHREAANGA